MVAPTVDRFHTSVTFKMAFDCSASVMRRVNFDCQSPRYRVPDMIWAVVNRRNFRLPSLPRWLTTPWSTDVLPTPAGPTSSTDRFSDSAATAAWISRSRKEGRPQGLDGLNEV